MWSEAELEEQRDAALEQLERCRRTALLAGALGLVIGLAVGWPL